MQHDQIIDIKGMCCSAPVIRLTKDFKSIESGKVVLVISDKSSMLNDIAAYCRMTSNTLLKQESRDGLINFWIKKK